MSLKLTPAAHDVFSKIADKTRELYIIIGDTGCCGYSNVFVTARKPVGDYFEAGSLMGAKVYLRPPLDRTLDLQRVIVDVVESPADDSLSLETELGYRFILRFKLD